MEANTDIRNFFAEKAEEFIKTLNGKFRDHVSDTFIKVYLVDRLDEEYRKFPSEHLRNISHRASLTLFESYLEYGCKAGGHGHHLAQKFSVLFPKKQMKDI